jgi:hypothetical protein
MAGELALGQHMGRVPWDASCSREQAALRSILPLSSRLRNALPLFKHCVSSGRRENISGVKIGSYPGQSRSIERELQSVRTHLVMLMTTKEGISLCLKRVA